VIDKGDTTIVGQRERHASMQIHRQGFFIPEVGVDVVLADVHEYVVFLEDVVHTAHPVAQRKEGPGVQSCCTHPGAG
jgi:hypothetical protein